MQVARKIAPCDWVLIHVCLAYTYFYTQDKFSVLLKCYFKRKYLNLIDSNCDVDEFCPWFFIGTVLATGPECIVNIQSVGFLAGPQALLGWCVHGALNEWARLDSRLGHELFFSVGFGVKKKGLSRVKKLKAFSILTKEMIKKTMHM